MAENFEPDTTIEDIHRIRRQISEKFGGDIEAIVEDARCRQAESDWPIWQGPANGQEVGTSAAKKD